MEYLIKNLLLLMACTLFAATTFAAAEKTEVKIGVIAPLTLGNAERGKEIVNTLETYVSMLNQNSERYVYRLVSEDGKCGIGSSATTAAEKLIRIDKVQFLITGCSGETLQAGPIAQRAGVLLFAVFSAHQDVKKLGDFIFRTCPDQERAAEIFAHEIECSKIDTLFLLSEENAFTQGMKSLLTAKAGKRISGSEDFPSEMTDFRTLLLRAKAARPQAIYLNAASPASLSNLVVQAKNLGVTVPLFGYLHPDDPSFFKSSGAESVGVRYLGVPDAVELPSEFREFSERYKKEFGMPQVEVVRRTTFDALKSIAAGIENVGPDPLKVRTFLQTYQAEGATGHLSYDENGDLKNLDYVMKVVTPEGTGRVASECKK